MAAIEHARRLQEHESGASFASLPGAEDGADETQQKALADATPPGWSYNPSAWKERRWLVGLAIIGWLAALYTMLGQVGAVTLWDPFFGAHSSYLVTHSAISRLLPIPDGALGIVGYSADLLFGAPGCDERWRKTPWLVILFGLTIIGLGIVSLALTITQGTIVQHWCTVCLISAAASTLILGLGIGETLASLQHIARQWRAGVSLWRALRGTGLPWR